MHGSETVAPNLVAPTYRAARRMRPPPEVATRGEESDRFCPSGLFIFFIARSLLGMRERTAGWRSRVLLCSTFSFDVFFLVLDRVSHILFYSID